MQRQPLALFTARAMAGQSGGYTSIVVACGLFTELDTI